MPASGQQVLDHAKDAAGGQILGDVPERGIVTELTAVVAGVLATHAR